MIDPKAGSTTAGKSATSRLVSRKWGTSYPLERKVGFGALVDWVVADIVRIENGIHVKHWDVIQDEATREQSKSGNPMFGQSFPR